MAQGAVKKKAQANPGKTTRAQTQKKGAVVKQKRVKTNADRIQKKYSAGLVTKTEKLLSERAGHLELLGKSKKGEKKAVDSKKQKGGTRKFG